MFTGVYISWTCYSRSGDNKYHGPDCIILLRNVLCIHWYFYTDPFSDSLEKWRNENRTAVWLQVPIHLSRHIAVAARYGFQFHNAEHDQCLLKLWLPDRVPDTTPRFATHQLGVCGKFYNSFIIIHDK